MPGQYLDAETGLHYNAQRYYDPARGEYLSPDPLGTPDGPNPYSYVRFNPLKYVDPEGLTLLAFDGTGNSDSAAELARLGNGTSNVVRFRDAYDSTANGARRYVSGVGTLHSDATWGDIENVTADAGTNRTGTRRIDRMLTYLYEEARDTVDTDVLQIDIVGFSRGAAEARDFANQVSRLTQRRANGQDWFSYHAKIRNAQGQDIDFTGCQRVNFRFMGLWDTVISTNSGRNYALGIPAAFQYVAQAVALNEYRSDPNINSIPFWNQTRAHRDGNSHFGGFPLECIGASSSAPGRTRIERGFIGAHADIGGGYPEGQNQLSCVALNWMVGQAQIAGVMMNTARVVAIPTTNPIIHDPSNALRFGNPLTAPPFQTPGSIYGTNQYVVEDRQVHGGLGGGTQRTQTFGPAEAGGNRSLTNAETHALINYTARPANIRQDTRITDNIPEIKALNNATGTVNIQDYTGWLRQHGYVFAGAGQF